MTEGSGTLPPGTRLGPYEIDSLSDPEVERLYRARDTRLDRTVAIQLLDREGSPHGADFEGHARVLSRLRHPRIAALYDVGERDGAPYLVREYVDGRTLAAHLREGPLPLTEALRYGAQIAEALEGGHGQGVAHGSLTPASVRLTHEGVTLVDFGVARLRRSSANHGLGADAASDLSALGRILREMVTGAPDLAEARPLAPPSLDRVVRRCLATDPDERWSNAGDLAAELRRLAEQETESALRTPAEGAPAKRRWLVAALLGGAIAAAVAYVLDGRR